MAARLLLIAKLARRRLLAAAGLPAVRPVESPQDAPIEGLSGPPQAEPLTLRNRVEAAGGFVKRGVA